MTNSEIIKYIRNPGFKDDKDIRKAFNKHMNVLDSLESADNYYAVKTLWEFLNALSKQIEKNELKEM